MKPRLTDKKSVTVVIDAFRAFATACYILNQKPQKYFLTDQCKVVNQLMSSLHDPILVGKPEIGSLVNYTIPNSPTRVETLKLEERNVIHRTAAGGLGVRCYNKSDILLGASFVNAKATAEAIQQINPSQLEIIPLGHEGITPTLEDDLCASYLKALIEGTRFELMSYIPDLRQGPGKYFFGADQYQYPQEDFNLCLALDTFAYPIYIENLGEFAILRTSGPDSLNDSIISTMTSRIPLP